MMDEELRQTMVEVREMKKMCGNINMKLTNIVTQRGQDWKKKLEAEYQRGLEDGKWKSEDGCTGCKYEWVEKDEEPCAHCANCYINHWTAKDDKIVVGDEVETKDGKRFVVTTFGSSLNGDIAVGVCADGFGLGVDLKELRKTGRHFDIASILEEMRHD